MRQCFVESACLHQTVNMVVFFFKNIEIPTQKGEYSCKCTELSLKYTCNVEASIHRVEVMRQCCVN